MEEPQEEKSLKDAGSSLSARHSETESPLKQIRTFQGDVASALERQKESLVSIQRTETLKRGGAIQSDGPRTGRSLLFFFASLVLITASALGGWLAYNEFLRKTAPPTLSVPGNRFISSEQSDKLDASGASKDELMAFITGSSSGVREGELKHLVLYNGDVETAPLMTSSEFLLKLEARAPGSLVRSFDPLFMLGTLGDNRFVIFKLVSFENAFAGMLGWEESLGEDMASIFGTAPLLKNTGPESVFKDVISKNKDVRVLYAPESPGSATTSPVLLYSFFDNRMLIITNNLETLQTLIDRLTRELLSR